jgi:hypothetical protein
LWAGSRGLRRRMPQPGFAQADDNQSGAFDRPSVVWLPHRTRQTTPPGRRYTDYGLQSAVGSRTALTAGVGAGIWEMSEMNHDGPVGMVGGRSTRMNSENHGETEETKLAASLHKALGSHSFKRLRTPPVIRGAEVLAAWRRWTLNTNRAVVLIRAPDAGLLGAFARRHRLALGWKIGFFPFFYSLGIQIVLAGRNVLDRATDLQASVDSVDNQLAIAQSIFAVDLATLESASARTWGQFITGEFQDAVQEGIAGYLAGRRSSSGPATE